MKYLGSLLLLLLLASSVNAQRAFLLVGESPPGLVRDFSSGEDVTGWLDLREYRESEGTLGLAVASFDTLKAWVQHFGPDSSLDVQAAEADLLIVCYPEMLPDGSRSRHALPSASGLIYLYGLFDVVYVSDRPIFELDVLHSFLGNAHPD